MDSSLFESTSEYQTPGNQARLESLTMNTMPRMDNSQFGLQQGSQALDPPLLRNVPMNTRQPQNSSNSTEQSPGDDFGLQFRDFEAELDKTVEKVHVDNLGSQINDNITVKSDSNQSEEMSIDRFMNQNASDEKFHFPAKVKLAVRHR